MNVLKIMNVNFNKITKNHSWSQRFRTFPFNEAVDEECLAVKLCLFRQTSKQVCSPC